MEDLKNKLTPMMRQWMDAKAKAKDAIVLFRMGDFYELFGDDAVRAAPILELALTSRDKDKEGGMPMAGFPHQAAPQYIAKLIAEGLKVAICDQLEDPKLAKGIVKRDITRVVTPGTVMDEQGLRANVNNYLAGVTEIQGTFGLCALDVSTGEFIATVTESEQALLEEIAILAPSELVVAADSLALKECLADLSCRLETRSLSSQKPNLAGSLGVLDPWFDEYASKAALLSTELVLSYVLETQGALYNHIRTPRPYAIDGQLLIDTTSRRHLDLVGAPGDLKREGTLLHVVDKTKTAMGGRQLLKWLLSPSTDLAVINGRLDVVQALYDEPNVRTLVREQLKAVYDIERLTAKCASGRVAPKELASLRDSIGELPGIVSALLEANVPTLRNRASIDVLQDVHELLDRALVANPPYALKDGGVFRQGHDPVLDDLVDLSAGGIAKIADIEQRERELTGIASLKVKYTRVFGYYIEITKTHLAKVPEHYRRKQTVASGERYVTEELARLEEQVAAAEARRSEREAELFDVLRRTLASHANRVLQTARLLAELDAFCSFAEVSDARRFVRPEVLPASSRCLHIVRGRHPIIESLSEKQGKPFVPNDVQLAGDNMQVLLITGPNMAGKSTIMRQVALIQLLAQAGCFVPAKAAQLSICDRIFTRVGASDDLRLGRSTFMVEMAETAHILNHATPNSLVLLDEIGRGTSTFDGLSIAWSVAEDLHNRVGARTLFATHYHELTVLSQTLSRLKNMHVAVQESEREISFMYLLAEGPATQSYGIHVARLAGLPEPVLDRAQEILRKLESQKQKFREERQQTGHSQMPLFM